MFNVHDSLVICRCTLDIHLKYYFPAFQRNNKKKYSPSLFDTLAVDLSFWVPCSRHCPHDPTCRSPRPPRTTQRPPLRYRGSERPHFRMQPTGRIIIRVHVEYMLEYKSEYMNKIELVTSNSLVYSDKSQLKERNSVPNQYEKQTCVTL